MAPKRSRATVALEMRLVKRTPGEPDVVLGTLVHETTIERGLDDLQAAMTAVRQRKDVERKAAPLRRPMTAGD